MPPEHPHARPEQVAGHQPDPADPHGLAYFDAEAATWDQDPEKAERARVVAEAIQAALPLTVRTTLLEYGAGTGAVGRHLAPAVGRVIIADASSGMVGAARAAIARERLTNTSARQLDLLTDPLPSTPVDVIATVLALHHVSDLDRVLRCFHDLLVPGGWLAICDLDRDPEGLFHSPGFTGHHGFERDHLGDLLRAAGFADPEFETVYSVAKEGEDGQVRDFPLFLAITRREALGEADPG